jgi:hypothetical protein
MREVAPAAPPEAKLAAKNFQKSSFFTPFMKICLYLSKYKFLFTFENQTFIFLQYFIRYILKSKISFTVC